MSQNQELEKLTASQHTTGELIETIIKNFKKDSQSRKTVEYYKERLERLDIAWSEFEITDNKIRCLEEVDYDHEYFKEKYYQKISEVTSKYKELFESAMSDPSTVDTKTTGATGAGTKITVQPIIPSRITTSIRRQNVMIESLKRLLAMEPPSASLKMKEKLWEQIQELHFSIGESSTDPIKDGYNMEGYTTIETEVYKSFKQESNAPEQGVTRNKTIQLPKITIPKFNGDYLKWASFFDLFSQLVENQAIPTIQKMWYLKSNLSGEAEQLISHLSATAENYETAWKLLRDRYNNKRVLVASIMNQLLEQPTITPTSTSIKKLHDITKECLHALQNMGITTSSWDPILVHMLIKKLDRGTHILYERSISNPKEVQGLNNFLEFLEARFQSMEAMGQKEKISPKICASAASPKERENTCSLCRNGSHPLFRCQQLLKMTPNERLNYAQKQRLCVNCLRTGHSAKACNSRACGKCNKKHNSLLHLENYKNSENNSKVTLSSSAKTPEVASATLSSSESTSLTVAGRQTYVLLSTALVVVKTSSEEIECRALLDSGSQVNFISERLVKRLGIPLQASRININGIGATTTKTQHRVNVALHSRINGFTTRLEALVLPRIISPQPSQFINTDEWALPKNLTLADPNFNRPDKIDLLLGAEHYHQLLAIGQIKLSKNLPIMQNTVLGWVISGKLQEGNPKEVYCGISTTEESLEASIAKLWELEEVKGSRKSLSLAEEKCEEHFSRHTSKGSDNRFIVRIPFHQDPKALGDSHSIALNRFLSLERRLQRNPQLRAEYIKFMEEYETTGHMTNISADAIEPPSYFIPHHCVLRPESSTTKLRVVFDASTKTSTGHSLNDLMYAGPTVQSDLFSILLRFRLPRYVFTTDVEKMYRQILISPEDRRFQLIIWRSDANMPLKYFQLNTVTYGTRAAPYLATRCLQQIASENSSRYPLASQFLKESFYVDDGLGGADNIATAMLIQEQLMTVMTENGFRLRKWCANHPQLLKNISQGDLEVNLDFENTRVHAIKTLGLTWLPKPDTLAVKVNIEDIKKITKRSVTSDLARLFDPLGILSPIIVTAKILIQELWELKLDWDQSLPAELHTRWLTFRADLEELKTLQISRHIFKGRLPESTQLHIFTDASERAYGAAAYMRATLKDGSITTRLLCAKSRVAPLKKQTIPRLELCAAALGAQLAERISVDIQFKGAIYFWTDSEIVLAWVNSTSAHNTFVANRLSTIKETTRVEQWRHVSSKENPADILSRGMSPRAFKDCALWFCGPIFLHGKEAVWPQSFKPAMSQTELELKTKHQRSLLVATEEEDFIYKINHKNSFQKLLRIVGYVVRFVTNSRCRNDSRKLSPSVTTAELEQALAHIVAQIQKSEFQKEIKTLREHKELQGSSNLSNLTPFIDNNGLLRVGGRLEASTLPYDSRHQLLIPYNDPISKLIFEMTHKENKHCGPQTLLGIVRQRFWPIKGKIMARATVHRCIVCSKAKPVLLKQVMGNLPSTRITPARPFVNSGVDYCGPVTIHYKIRGKRPHKAYIAVFVCFATKAVHLEVVSDLTTDAFIGALKRFTSRRGHCQTLYCDNATNFVGAKNKLPELTTIIHAPKAQEQITNACSKSGIQFTFIPPRAPHFGGLWEAAVKSAKHLLTRSLGNSSLTYEELETLIIEIEAIMNSRPISPMSDNPNDIGALTPGHFLIGEPLTAQIDAQANITNLKLETRWKLVSQLKHEFWKRWSRDYLNELQYRNKWKTQSANIKSGDIVVIKEDNIPVMKWPLGRIVKTYTGPDGAVRVADVKTASGVLKRAIRYLAPIPRLNDEAEGDQMIINQDSESSSTTHKEAPDPPSSDERPREKRRRTTAMSTMTTLLISLLALPLVFTSQIETSEFEPRIGIHFEGISNLKVSRSEWTIISYYELQPYWHEMEVLTNGTRSLKYCCNLATQKTACTNFLKTIELDLADLTEENSLLKERRVKRGAINFVGNIANSLFGILDSEYAENMSNTISLLNKDENHLNALLKNQTSIIDATLNIFKQSEHHIKDKFDNLDAQLAEINSRLLVNENQNRQSNIDQIFMGLSSQLSITSARLHRMQAILISALSDSHNGKMSPMLLSPSQLRREVERVRNNLPTFLQLPVDQRNLLQLYKIMKVKGGLTNNHVGVTKIFGMASLPTLGFLC